MRFQFVPGREPPALLDLPWDDPLLAWDDHRLVRMAHGLSRHVVRFVRDGERVYALKELPDLDAVHEYRMLRLLAEHRQPTGEAVGSVTDRPGGLEAVLVTRYLDYSLPFHYLLGAEGGEGAMPPRAVVAARWISDVYEPIVAAVPAELWAGREAPELFHELLEHRYYLSEAAGHEVDNEHALASYVTTVLARRPPERLLLDP